MFPGALVRGISDQGAYNQGALCRFRFLAALRK